MVQSRRDIISKTSFTPYQKTNCRYCGSKLEASFLDLGIMPLANSFLTKKQLNETEFVCPLSVTWCSECTLAQLTHAVPPKLLFSNYLYVSSTTKTFQKHFSEYAKMVKSRLNSKRKLLAVDIGSNDGLLLSHFQNEGMVAVGVEPAKNLSVEANAKGLETINRFFDQGCVNEIVSKHGRAHTITANNVFAHIDDIDTVCKNVINLLDADGLFVIEFPYLFVMLDQMLFDMIYHEHLSYISVTALNYLMKKHRLRICDIVPVSSHGGSLRVFICKETASFKSNSIVDQMLLNEKGRGCFSKNVYEEFGNRVRQTREQLNQFIIDIKREEKTISGYGAPAKATTIISYCGWNSSQIDYIVDDNPLKQNMFTPGSKIPVYSSQYLDNHLTDYIIIFAWNFATEIIDKMQHLKNTRFIIPLPQPKIV